MNARAVIGLDVGGTTIKAALLDGELRTLATRRMATPRPARSGVAPELPVLDAVSELVADLSGVDGAALTPGALGVVVPGVVDERAGIARYSGNLGWRDVPFAELLGTRTELPVAFGHDVRAGGIAEARFGAASGAREIAFIPVGTGISAALLLDGRPLSGGGYAGELGHIDTGHGGRCACGATGCLEAIASCAAIARRYTERTGRRIDGAQDVLDAMRHGDPDAGAVFTDAVHALGHGIRTLLTLFAPEIVVLGGGLGAAGEDLLAPLRAWLGEHLSFQRMPELRSAWLGDEAGCLGAGLLAQEVLR